MLSYRREWLAQLQLRVPRVLHLGWQQKVPERDSDNHCHYLDEAASPFIWWFSFFSVAGRWFSSAISSPTVRVELLCSRFGCLNRSSTILVVLSRAPT